MIPTSLDEYLAEHKAGDIVTGRVVEVAKGEGSSGSARVELGEGIQTTCRITKPSAKEDNKVELTADVSSLGSMLAARWRGGTGGEKPKAEVVHAGQIRDFRIVKLDPEVKKIEVEFA
jgi:small subunit ribosomal protein S1